MHGRKRESTASRLERRAKSLPKVKLLQKLHKEIVHLQNADDNETDSGGVQEPKLLQSFSGCGTDGGRYRRPDLASHRRGIIQSVS